MDNDSTQQEQSQTLTYHSTPTVPAAAHLLQQQHQQLQMFWSYQCEDIKQLTDFKNHPLPLARIKKIMKADEDVRMIAAEAPVLFAKACELFILELTIRSWLHAEENRRRTLQKNDLSAAITRTDIFDFLVDIVPREDGRDESVVFGAGGGGMIGGAGTAAGGVPCYYVQPSMGRPALPPGGMRIGQTGIDLSAVYGQPSQAWQSVWQNAAAGPDDGSYGGESNGQDSQS